MEYRYFLKLINADKIFYISLLKKLLTVMYTRNLTLQNSVYTLKLSFEI
jgi:hypothetical protein